jgi:hypothetical protein
MKTIAVCAAALGLLGFAPVALAANSTAQLVTTPSSAASSTGLDGNVMLVADGCGFDRYRGPGGACHRFGTGPYPSGYYPDAYDAYCGTHRVWVPGPWGGHWAWVSNC